MSDLKNKATAIWKKYRGTSGRPTKAEYAVLSEAYWANLLPKDSDYSVSQWVEDVAEQ